MSNRTKRHKSRQPGQAADSLPAAAVARLGKAADPIVAKQLGVSTYRIKQERRRLQIPAFVSGGARSGSGPDPELGPGNVRSVIKTVRLSPGEEKSQIAAAKAAGAKDWGTWIRDVGNAAARYLSVSTACCATLDGTEAE